MSFQQWWVGGQAPGVDSFFVGGASFHSFSLWSVRVHQSRSERGVDRPWSMVVKPIAGVPRKRVAARWITCAPESQRRVVDVAD